MKKFFSVIIIFNMIMLSATFAEAESQWVLTSGTAEIFETQSGVAVEYTSGTPGIKYNSETSHSGIISAEFDVSLEFSRLQQINAYASDGTRAFYILPSARIFAVKENWNQEVIGYDVGEYTSHKFRFIIDTEKNTYSLFINGYKMFSDFTFLNDVDDIKSIEFILSEPFFNEPSKLSIENMSLKTVTAEELSIEIFGEESETKISDETIKEIYVSPLGNDENNGTLNSPFKTLSYAKEYVKKLKNEKGLSDGGITVYLREGEYTLTESIKYDMSDSGYENAPIKYVAYNGEKVKITGAEKISASLFLPVSDEEILERLPENSKGKVMEIQLGNALELVAMGDSGKKNIGPSVIFVNDKILSPSRFPNAGYITVDSVSDSGALIFNNIGTWQDLKYSMIYGWTNGWYDGSSRIGYDNGIIKRTPLANGDISAGDKVYFLNILEELDCEGEWYINEETNMLYIWLPENTSEIGITSLKDSLVKIYGTKYVEFSGIEFGNTRGNAVSAYKSENVSFEGCKFDNIGRQAVSFDSTVNCTLESCDIFNTGRGAVTVSGGERETLTCGNNAVKNCHIRNFDMHSKTTAYAIYLDGVGNYAQHNLISDASHQAIGFSGNLNKIENNEIYGVLYESDDAGAIYSGKSFVNRGNEINSNYIHGIAHGEGIQNNRMGIYLDDHLNGTIVTNNLIEDCNVSVLLHGGRNHNVTNNVSVDCEKGVTAIDWYYTYNLDNANYEMWTELDASPYQTELWQNTFPNLIDIREDEPKISKYNVVKNNISVNCKTRTTVSSNYITYGTVKNNDLSGTIPNISDKGLYFDSFRKEMPKLGDFQLNYPLNNMEKVNGNSITFHWEKADNAEKYRIEISEYEDFSVLAENETIYGKNYITIDSLKNNGTKYFWRVTALYKEAEKASEAFSFTTRSISYSDNFDDGIIPSEYHIDNDGNDSITISDGQLVYTRKDVSAAANTGLYRDVDIDLSEVESGILVIEYDVYPKTIKLTKAVYNFPAIADSEGKNYVYNYADTKHKNFNSTGSNNVYGWSSFTQWNDESTEDYVYKMKAIIDVENSTQSLYTSISGEYTGYENKKFSSLETNEKISRIYFCKPDTWCNVEIAIDNLKIYEYMPFEFNGISDDGGVLFNETPEIDITFNSRVEEKTFSGIVLKSGNENISVKCNLKNDTTVAVSPSKPLKWEKEYTLYITKELKNIYGQSLEEELSYSYTVRENTQKNSHILLHEDFNGGFNENYLIDGDLSESLTFSAGQLNYSKSNTYGVVTSGLKRNLDINMNTLPEKKVIIEYDLYPKMLRNDDGWLYGFPAVYDENGMRYCSFYFEAPDLLVKYYTGGTGRPVGGFFHGDGVMYRVSLQFDFEGGKYLGEFKRYDTLTGEYIDSITLAEDTFFENVSGKIASISFIEGAKWGKFDITIDNFTVTGIPDVREITLTDKSGEVVTEIQGNTTYRLTINIKNYSYDNYVNILAEYDGNNRLLNAEILDKTVTEKEFTTKESTNKLKVFTWTSIESLKPTAEEISW